MKAVREVELLGRKRSRLSFWVALSGGWLVWGAIYAIHLRGVKEGQTTLQVLRYAFSDAFLWALATPLVFRLARSFSVRAPRALAHLAVHALLAPAVAFTVLALDGLLDQLFLGVRDGIWRIDLFAIPSLRYRIHSNLLIYASLVAIGHWLQYHHRLQESERSLSVLRAELAEARLRALRSKLRPHFLFNCLNTIAGLVDSRPEEARAMVGRLSELLRLALRAPLAETIPLREELHFVETYLALEKARFGDRLCVELDVSEVCEALPVPAILLQPLVENAVIHGISPKIEGGRVAVRAWRADGRLELRVEDDGVGFADSLNVGFADSLNGSGIGLSSVRSRLRALYGAEQSCEIRALEDGGTEVAISIPIAESPS